MSKKKPTVLMILDGYGLNDKVEGNAVKQANTPVMDDLMANLSLIHIQVFKSISSIEGFRMKCWKKENGQV